MGQVGHFKMTHLYHPPFHMAHPSRGTPVDAYGLLDLLDFHVGELIAALVSGVAGVTFEPAPFDRVL